MLEKLDKYVSSILQRALLQEIVDAFSILLPYSALFSLLLLITQAIPVLAGVSLILKSNMNAVFLFLYALYGYHFFRDLKDAFKISILGLSLLSFMILNPSLRIEHLPFYTLWVLSIRILTKIITRITLKFTLKKIRIPISVLETARHLFKNCVLWVIVLLFTYLIMDSKLIQLLFSLEKGITAIMSFLPVYLLMMLLMLLLWTYGIHGDQIVGRFLDPFLIIFMLMNLQGTIEPASNPIVINASFHLVYAMGTGTGMTGMLLLALFMFDKSTSHDYKSLSEGTVFNINEPVIFGLPIAYNDALRLPFIIAPLVSILFAWAMTHFGYAKVLIYPVPWITPPLLKSFIASGGEWSSVLVELCSYVLAFIIYALFIIRDQRKQGKAS